MYCASTTNTPASKVVVRMKRMVSESLLQRNITWSDTPLFLSHEKLCKEEVSVVKRQAMYSVPVQLQLQRSWSIARLESHWAEMWIWVQQVEGKCIRISYRSKFRKSGGSNTYPLPQPRPLASIGMHSSQTMRLVPSSREQARLNSNHSMSSYSTMEGAPLISVDLYWIERSLLVFLARLSSRPTLHIEVSEVQKGWQRANILLTTLQRHAQCLETSYGNRICILLEIQLRLEW